MDKKYPILYYDLNTTDADTLQQVYEQLGDYFKREKVPFVMLPKTISLEWMTKNEAIESLTKVLDEVKKWE